MEKEAGREEEKKEVIKTSGSVEPPSERLSEVEVDMLRRGIPIYGPDVSGSGREPWLKQFVRRLRRGIALKSGSELPNLQARLFDFITGSAVEQLKIPLENLRVLDVGCGVGDLVGALQNAGAREVYGVDQSSRAIEMGHRKGIRNLEVGGTWDRLPYPDGFFDVTVSSAVFEYGITREDVGEIARVSRSGSLHYHIGGDFQKQLPYFEETGFTILQSRSWGAMLQKKQG